MSEAEYLHECGRAELLGLPKPTREEFFSRPRDLATEGSAQEEEEHEITAEQTQLFQDEGIKREGFRRIGGGLDELNSILSSTQKKLNRFKSVCGSFTNILKLQVATKKEENENPVDTGTREGEEKNLPAESFSANINKSGNSQLDKLDSLINKAERAEISLSSQNKQMKKFFN